MRTVDRMKRFFGVSALKCPKCGELGHTVERGPDIEVTKKPEFYGIETVSEWEEKMDQEMEWAIANKDEVLSVLPELEDEWPESCRVLRKVLEAARRQEKQEKTK